MSIDFNNIEPNSSSSGEFELIPENTIARVNLLLEAVSYTHLTLPTKA